MPDTTATTLSATTRPPTLEIDDLAFLHRCAASAERMLLEHFEYMEELPICPGTHQLNETIDILARLTAIRKSLIRLHRGKLPTPNKIEEIRETLSSATTALSTLINSDTNASSSSPSDGSPTFPTQSISSISPSRSSALSPQSSSSSADLCSSATNSSDFSASSVVENSAIRNPHSALDEPSFTAPPVSGNENAAYSSGLEPRPPYYCNHGEFAFSAPDPEPSIREVRETAAMPLECIQPALNRVNDALEVLPKRPVSPAFPPLPPPPQLTEDGRLPWVAYREYMAKKLAEEKAKAKKLEERKKADAKDLEEPKKTEANSPLPSVPLFPSFPSDLSDLSDPLDPSPPPDEINEIGDG